MLFRSRGGRGSEWTALSICVPLELSPSFNAPTSPVGISLSNNIEPSGTPLSATGSNVSDQTGLSLSLKHGDVLYAKEAISMSDMLRILALPTLPVKHHSIIPTQQATNETKILRKNNSYLSPPNEAPRNIQSFISKLLPFSFYPAATCLVRIWGTFRAF